MLAIGGGKGTYSAGSIHDLPWVSPSSRFDLQLGSTADDGNGGVALHREMVSAPDRFFSSTYQDCEETELDCFSLDRGINDPQGPWREFQPRCLPSELDSVPPTGPVNEHQDDERLTAWQAVKVTPYRIASAIKIIEWARGSATFRCSRSY